MANADSTPYRKLRHCTSIILCMVVALPLALIGSGAYFKYRGSVTEETAARLTAIVSEHQEPIERFLAEISTAMRVVAQLSTLDELSRNGELQKTLAILQKEHDNAFEGLGVIDAKGSYNAYVGPFGLPEKNYSEASWFKKTMEKGAYVSDVFSGFRRAPHFIIAVKQGSGQQAWILMSTVNAARLGRFLENVRAGRTGEAFLVNREGYLQTGSRTNGNVMEQLAPGFFDSGTFEGIKFQEMEIKGHKLLSAKTWLKDNEWLLMVQQDADDALADLYATRNMILIVSLCSAFLIAIVAFFTTRLLFRKIEQSNAEKLLIGEELIESQKLASIGQLVAGIAHEINNPLAVIGREVEWSESILEEASPENMQYLEEFTDSLREITKQVDRCQQLTHRLLTFSRKWELQVCNVVLNKLIEDMAILVEKIMDNKDIQIVRDYAGDIPPISCDPSLLNHIMLNILTNATHAIERAGRISIKTRASANGTVEIVVNDTGCGIPAGNMNRIFDPLFTTKPKGKGIGLGLSMCRSIIARLGGEIRMESKVGTGTTVTICLPREGIRKEVAGKRPMAPPVFMNRRS